ncbi:type IV pilin protein [Sessilibacter sp. MAH2]
MSINTTQRGFTLIEVIIVVAIIGILASIAFPAYQSQVDKGYRSDAQGALTAFAQAMERYYTANGTYVGAEVGGDPAGAEIAFGDAPVAPRIFSQQVPLNGGAAVYDLVIAEATATGYTIYARPLAGARMTGDGLFAIRGNGRRGWDRNDNNDPFEAGETCWEQEC